MGAGVQHDMVVVVADKRTSEVAADKRTAAPPCPPVTVSRRQHICPKPTAASRRACAFGPAIPVSLRHTDGRACDAVPLRYRSR
jgi:hypothetical protein